MGHAELEPEDIDKSITPFYGALKRTWAAFCVTTSIHGLKYTKDEDTNKTVRFLWLLLTLVMFVCAVLMVCNFYLDYRSNPTRLNVENDYALVSSLYFPAVTVCPEVLYNMLKAREFIDTLKMPDGADVKEVLNGLRLNYGFIKDEERFDRHQVDLMDYVLQLNNLTMLEFQDGVRWDCDDYMFRCRYHWQIVDCTSIFQVSKTFYGNCCSFNLNQSSLSRNKKPFKGQFALPGFQNGLSIIVYYNEKFDLVNSYSHGFRMLLHENNAFPSARPLSKFLSLNEEIFITVRPVETFCSNAVKKLPMEERQCVFPDEFYLEHFDLYVGTNCELNYRVTNMIKFCGCLTFFFYTNRTNDRVCTYTDMPCLVERFADIIGRFRNTQITCPDNCESINYELSLTSAKLQLDIPTVDNFYTRNSNYAPLSINSNGIGKDFTVAHIFVNSPVYRRVRHDLLSNTVSLVANLGSAFSLFVGMSMVSIVEIIYYFTIILQKYYRQEKKAREKLLFRQKFVENLTPADAILHTQ